MKTLKLNCDRPEVEAMIDEMKIEFPSFSRTDHPMIGEKVVLPTETEGSVIYQVESKSFLR